MSRIVVSYQGLKVGTLAEARGGIFFEYDPGFIASGHELSPLYLPLGSGLRARDSSPTMRLPGLFEDSLPDNWGRRVMLEWFRQQGTPEHAVTPLMMLAYVAHRGMGALTYSPALDVAAAGDRSVSLLNLYQAARMADSSGPIDLAVLAQVGSSAGGARPKALIGLPRDPSGTILAGDDELPPTHDAWLVKLDTSRDATDGPMEEAYARMARAAGVDLPETRLLETRQADGVRRHFAVKRFDRSGSERIHHHTLAALCHVGGGDLNYETLLRVTRRLTHDEREVWRAFRRAAFNVLASNRDDHGKNHGFLYRNREWTLGPAYDLTFSSPQQLPERGISICGERRAATVSHLIQLGESEALDHRTVRSIIEEVRSAISRWREFAEQSQVPPIKAAEVDPALQSRP